MFKTSLATLFALSLVGCGDGGSVVAVGKDISITTSLQNTSPSLTAVDWSGDDTDIKNNESAQGSLRTDAEQQWLYSASTSGYLTLVLTGPERADFDLAIEDLDSDYSDDAQNKGSDETLILRVIAGHQYRITVNAYSGSGNYQMAVAAPSRRILGMRDKEYLTLFSFSFSGTCSDSNSWYGAYSPTVWEANSTVFLYINFADGYVRTLDGTRHGMSRVNEREMAGTIEFSGDEIVTENGTRYRSRFNDEFRFDGTFNSNRSRATLAIREIYFDEFTRQSDGAWIRTDCDARGSGRADFLL